MDMKWLNFSRKILGEWEPKPTPSKIKVKGNKFAQNISANNTHETPIICLPVFSILYICVLVTAISPNFGFKIKCN